MSKAHSVNRTPPVNLFGQRIGRLLVETLHHRDAKGNAFYNCRCDCGTVCVIRRNDLVSKRRPTRSCGCLKRDFAASQTVDLMGQTFGRLTVIARDGCTRLGQARWLCQCVCGKQTSVISNQLISGKTRSCRCLADDLTSIRSRTHGATANGKWTAEYRSWSSMIQRCHNPNHKNYADYGGRGIVVCERWRNSFADFRADMGERPSKYHELDRLGNNLGYCKENCRWATRKEQMNNTRVNTLLTCQGRTQTLQQWADEVGVGSSLLCQRIGKLAWPIEEALGFTPHVHRATRLTATEHKLRRQARDAIGNAVYYGKLPVVSTLQCILCSRPAEDYHHYLGYEEQFWLSVQPLCRKCHKKQ